ncbi:hypothetical protein BDV93DRAFT_566806 [Ceratobasidium sp. AG-I]|nr:hypothetical protein BDV93DRAFT_566806 [Ceratobasidium sp. AG-I]
MSEAGVLGLEAVVHVAKIREKEQRRRGRDVDAAEELKVGTADGHANSPGSINVPATPGNADPMAPTTLSSDPDKAEEPEADTKEKDAETTLKPCFIDFPAPSEEVIRSSHLWSYDSRDRIELNVPGCECSIPFFCNPSELATCQCKLPPCAVSAFKQLQIQQRTHKNNISALESTIEQIQVAMSHPKPTAKNTSKAVPTPSSRFSTLQDDVRNWLGSKRRDNFPL